MLRAIQSHFDGAAQLIMRRLVEAGNVLIVDPKPSFRLVRRCHKQPPLPFIDCSQLFHVFTLRTKRKPVHSMTATNPVFSIYEHTA
ncbi:hypothetical protein M2332_003259 [Sphingobium sp. B11D3A]|nr:hypothetical protein [Sphingobium sp. B11D3A]